MKRDKERLIKRARYVQQEVGKINTTLNAVEILADRLFVSPETIYNDLKKKL
jgi:DeoR/GlpR family transcriptional regulator of sugar metabolism